MIGGISVCEMSQAQYASASCQQIVNKNTKHHMDDMYICGSLSWKVEGQLFT